MRRQERREVILRVGDKQSESDSESSGTFSSTEAVFSSLDGAKEMWSSK